MDHDWTARKYKSWMIKGTGTSETCNTCVLRSKRKMRDENRGDKIFVESRETPFERDQCSAIIVHHHVAVSCSRGSILAFVLYFYGLNAPPLLHKQLLIIISSKLLSDIAACQYVTATRRQQDFCAKRYSSDA